MTTEEFLEVWHKAVAETDMDLLATIIADDATIASPAYWAPKGPKSHVLKILTAVTSVFEDFHYVKEWIDGDELLLEFAAHVEDIHLKGIDRISLNSEGKLQHIEVMIRPINALFKMVEHVKGAFDE